MNITKIIAPNRTLFLKLFSLMLGYGVWLSISSILPASQTLTIPVHIYNQSEHQNVTLPESISLTLHGSRRLLSFIHYHDLAVHIDASTLTPGTHYLSLTPAHLLIPQEISLVHSTPLPVHVTLTNR